MIEDEITVMIGEAEMPCVVDYDYSLKYDEYTVNSTHWIHPTKGKMWLQDAPDSFTVALEAKIEALRAGI